MFKLKYFLFLSILVSFSTSCSKDSDKSMNEMLSISDFQGVYEPVEKDYEDDLEFVTDEGTRYYTVAILNSIEFTDIEINHTFEDGTSLEVFQGNIDAYTLPGDESEPWEFEETFYYSIVLSTATEITIAIYRYDDSEIYQELIFEKNDNEAELNLVSQGYLEFLESEGWVDEQIEGIILIRKK